MNLRCEDCGRESPDVLVWHSDRGERPLCDRCVHRYCKNVYVCDLRIPNGFTSRSEESCTTLSN